MAVLVIFDQKLLHIFLEKRMKRDISFAAVFFIAAWMLLGAVNQVSGQLGVVKTVEFKGQHIRLLFKPSLRSGHHDTNPLFIEVPTINFLMAMTDNYLTYLARLNRIAPATYLTFEYSPGQGNDSSGASRIPRLEELGFNYFLSRVNDELLRFTTTDPNFLIETFASLGDLRDQLPRNTDTFELRYQFANLSGNPGGLIPEVDFTAGSSGTAYSIRFNGGSTSIVRFESSSPGEFKTVIDESGQFISSLSLSSDERFVAFPTRSLEVAKHSNLCVSKTEQGGSVQLFPGRSVTVLGMAWSPKKPVLAGVVLDRSSAERELFVYDAESGEHLTFFKDVKEVDGNFLFAHPYWSPMGDRFLVTTGNHLHLFDTSQRKVWNDIFESKNLLSQFIWSPNGNAFAFVEVKGHSRDKNYYDERDFRSTTLRRFNIHPDSSVMEDISQTYSSPETIVPVSFWTLDRIFFLEGHLSGFRRASPIWNFESRLVARLTPAPSRLPNGEGSETKSVTTGFTDLPMAYCYAFKSLDKRFNNIYNAGLSGANHLYTDRMTTNWFIGLRVPKEIGSRHSSFCIRPSPYPFPDHNNFYFLDYQPSRIQNLLERLNSYNLRRFEIDVEKRRLFFLSNSSGLLNLWAGSLDSFSESFASILEPLITD